jgi:hypothetical protein
VLLPKEFMHSLVNRVTYHVAMERVTTILSFDQSFCQVLIHD